MPIRCGKFVALRPSGPGFRRFGAVSWRFKPGRAPTDLGEARLGTSFALGKLMWALGLGLSVLIGVTLGLLGGGGSILTVPILVYVFGLEPHPAIATSLLVVGTTSLVALVPHARAGRVNLKTGLTFGLAGMAGAFLAGRVSAYVAGRTLLVGFALLMVVAAIAMFRGRRDDTAVRPLAPLKTAVLGLVVGSVTGLVGAGGGFVIVPALVLLGGLPMPMAIGTSLLVIALQSAAGLVGHLGEVDLDWRLAGAVTTAAVLGSFVGSRLAGKFSPSTLRRGFGVFVLVMAAWMLFKELGP